MSQAADFDPTPPEEDGLETDSSAEIPSASKRVRIEALFILLVFILPMIITVFEVLSGGLVSRWWMNSVKPILPNIIDRVRF
jgi:hypothetical protein